MNIKKCTSLLLVLLLLVSNVGLAFNVHYCAGEIASVSVNRNTPKKAQKDCCKKAQTKKESCCKDKVVHFQKKSDDTILKVFSVASPYCLVIPQTQEIVFYSTSIKKNTSTESYFCDSNALPLFKLYSQYIFYA